MTDETPRRSDSTSDVDRGAGAIDGRLPPRSIHVDRIPPTAWANGLGSTLVAATAPCPSRRHPFGVRLSVAELPESSAFSPLPGVARVFTLIGAAGGTLRVGDRDHVLAPLEPCAFDGGLDTAFRPEAPTRAFNVMACACVDASVSIVHLESTRELPAATIAGYVARGGVGRADDASLAAGTVLVDLPGLWPWIEHATPATTLIAVRARGLSAPIGLHDAAR